MTLAVTPVHAAPAQQTACDTGRSQHASGVLNGNIYTVAPGDTSYSIAQRFCISVSALSQANGGYGPENLNAGAQLVIPNSGATGNGGSAANAVVVTQNVTASAIANAQAVGGSAIASAQASAAVAVVTTGNTVQPPIAPPLPQTYPAGNQPTPPDQPDYNQWPFLFIDIPDAGARVPFSLAVVGRGHLCSGSVITVRAYDVWRRQIARVQTTLTPAGGPSPCDGIFTAVLELTNMWPGSTVYIVAEAGGVVSASRWVIYGGGYVPGPPLNGGSLGECCGGLIREIWDTVTSPGPGSGRSEPDGSALSRGDYTDFSPIACRVVLTKLENIYFYPNTTPSALFAPGEYQVVGRTELAGSVWYLLQLTPNAPAFWANAAEIDPPQGCR